MEYNDIKQIIDDNIKTNTSQEITAIVANTVMTAMIDYTRDSIIEVINQSASGGAFSWLDVEADSIIPYPQMSAGRARVVRIFKDGVEFPNGEATIGGVNGVTIKHHALVICLEATNESANDGSQETVGDRFAVINADGSGGGLENIIDTPTGVEVLGRLDSDATVERRTIAEVSSSFIIDLNNPSGQYDLTLIDNTSIGFSNMIGDNQSTVITLVVSGNYSLLFPSWLKPMPNNDDYYSTTPEEVNLITILIRHGGAGSPQGIYSLTNIDLS